MRISWFFLWVATAAAQELPLPEKDPVEEQLRLQIYLDQQQFRPGKLDGRQGEFTEKALVRVARARGLTPEKIYKEAEAKVPILYQEHEVRAADFEFVAPVPEDPEAMAGEKFLAYRTLGEMIAERYHTDLGYLKSLNVRVDLDHLEVGAKVMVPAVPAFPIEVSFPDAHLPGPATMAHVPIGEPSVARSVAVDRAERILEVWEGEKLIASFPVSVGPPENETPAGEHTIKSLTYQPTFRYDKKMLKEGIRGEEAKILPPGPNNLVGVLWIQLSHDGIGIHGTDDPDLIGRNLSSGCIRMSNWDVVTFATLIAPGTQVTVR
jgi:lipoprotein-anchoring transpeptidase ErfK/SrfK